VLDESTARAIQPSLAEEPNRTAQLRTPVHRKKEKRREKKRKKKGRRKMNNSKTEVKRANLQC
jgi:hypothetical protein